MDEKMVTDQLCPEFISSELRGFAPSRETVFCANLQMVQEK